MGYAEAMAARNARVGTPTESAGMRRVPAPNGIPSREELPSEATAQALTGMGEPQIAEADEDYYTPSGAKYTPSEPVNNMIERAVAKTAGRRNRTRRGSISGQETSSIASDVISLGANVAASSAAAYLTGGHSIWMKMLAQGLATAPTEYVARRMTGRPHDESLMRAFETGATDAAIEGVLPGLGGAANAARKGAQKHGLKMQNRMRRIRNLPEVPKDPRLGDMSHPFKDFKTEDADDVYAALKDVEQIPLPGQLIEHNIIDRSQNVAKAALFSGGLENRALGGQRAVAKRLKEIVGELPYVSPEQAAKLLEDLRTGRLREVKGAAQGIYKQIDKILEAQTVTRNVTKEVPTGIGSLTPNPVTRTVVTGTREEIVGNGVDIRSIKALLRKRVEPKVLLTERWASIKKILDMDDVISYADASSIRTDLFDISGQFNPGRDAVLKRDKATAQALSGKLTNAINTTVDNAGPVVKAMKEEADRMWRAEVRGDLTHALVNNMFERAPEDLVRTLARGDVGVIRMVQEIVEKQSPGEWQKIQGVFLTELLREAGDTSTAVGVGLSGNKLTAALHDLGKMEGAKLNAFFPDAASRKTLKGFERYAKALQATQRPAGGQGSGVVWFQLMQAAGIAGVLSGGLEMAMGGSFADAAGGGLGAAAAFSIITPQVFSKMLRNPQVVEYLIKGGTSPPGSRAAGGALLGISSYLAREGLIEDEDRAKMQQVVSTGRLWEKTTDTQRKNPIQAPLPQSGETTSRRSPASRTAMP